MGVVFFYFEYTTIHFHQMSKGYEQGSLSHLFRLNKHKMNKKIITTTDCQFEYFLFLDVLRKNFKDLRFLRTKNILNVVLKKLSNHIREYTHKSRCKISVVFIHQSGNQEMISYRFKP
ncbi:hypothetical protein BpHYR1_016976 [Brachionus plicatilis]|uniref:Uncharacterized protein n=1 Tax=Brachionus plicatilis TaxID=10195 RepID=A0A3M7S9G3_BRAPC|nr:hypothetical protein BpHYR1_016976 [Brachionus plicatilis]